MALTKHTPGPWKVIYDSPTATIAGHIIKKDDSVERPICTVYEGGGVKGKPEQRANAKLIAAAPELLAACKMMMATIHQGVIMNRGSAMQKMILNAVEKATGENQDAFL